MSAGRKVSVRFTASNRRGKCTCQLGKRGSSKGEFENVACPEHECIRVAASDDLYTDGQAFRGCARVEAGSGKPELIAPCGEVGEQFVAALRFGESHGYARINRTDHEVVTFEECVDASAKLAPLDQRAK